MLGFIKYCLLGLVLLLVCFSSALLSMRFAIHGREMRVPKFIGLTPQEADRLATSEGLAISMENRFYSPNVPEGMIVSQSPPPNAKVRRGWRVRLAESLGPQRALVPNVIGESERVAEVNISRRGLQVGTVATIHDPGSLPSIVIAQNPPADAKDASSPQVNLVISGPDASRAYVMPNFVGQPMSDTVPAIQEAGFTLGKIEYLHTDQGSPGVILRQLPSAGQKILSGATINFEVSSQKTSQPQTNTDHRR